jgi:hypothetical protein
MLRINLVKKALKRHVVAILGRVEYDGGVPLNPLTARAFLDLPPFSYDQVEAAIDDLLLEGEVVERPHWLTGERMIGLSRIVLEAERRAA